MTTASHPMSLPRTEPGRPGWRPRSVQVGHHGKRFTASLTCPQCRKDYVLGPAYGLQDDGLVQPAVSCLCGWCEHVMLEGYADLFAPLIGGRDVPELEEQPRLLDFG